MKFILFLLFLILMAIGIFLLKTSSGVILITLPHWTMQSPLWLGVLSMLVTFIILHYLLRFFLFIKNIIPRWKKRKIYKKVLKTLSIIKKALAAFIENDLASASNYFQKAADCDDDFIEAKIMSSKLLIGKNKHVVPDSLLLDNKKTLPLQKQLIQFFQAENDINQGQYKSAIERLIPLSKKQSAIDLLARAYTETGDYTRLKDLLPCLKKSKSLNEEQFCRLEEKIYIEEIKNHSHHLSSLENFWDALPRYIKKNQNILFVYAKSVISLKQNDEIATLLIKSINNHWNGNLVSLLGQLTLQNQNKLLKIAERWKNNHPQDPDLLLSLAKINLHLKLWKTAETYLKELVEKSPSNDAYLLLGNLYDHMGEKQKELELYKKIILNAQAK